MNRKELGAAFRIGSVLVLGGLTVAEVACDQTPAIVEPAAGNGIPDTDPTALPLAAPTELRSAPELAPAATATAEAKPSPTPTMVPLESLDGSYTSEQQALADLTFEKVVNEAVISGDAKLQAYELNGTIFYKDADPNNPRLNLDYGRDAANVTVIVADPTLEAGYYILRVSEINDDLEAHNLPRSAVDFNVDSSGNFLGVDAQGKTLATRNSFQKADGTQAAVFVPDGATLTYDENNLLNGYEFNGIRYSFNPDTGEFTKTPIPIPTPELSYEPWGVWPSQAEITSAVDIVGQRTWPLKLDEFGLPWHQLSGVVTNPRVTNIVVGGRFEIGLAYDLYFDPSQPEKKVSMPIYAYDRAEDRWLIFLAGSTIEGKKDENAYPEVLAYVFGGDQTTMKNVWVSVDREEFENYSPAHFNGGIGQDDFAALMYDALNVPKSDIDAFIVTGDVKTLPIINGEHWLFPNQVDELFK